MVSLNTLHLAVAVWCSRYVRPQYDFNLCHFSQKHSMLIFMKHVTGQSVASLVSSHHQYSVKAPLQRVRNCCTEGTYCRNGEFCTVFRHIRVIIVTYTLECYCLTGGPNRITITNFAKICYTSVSIAKPCLPNTRNKNSFVYCHSCLLCIQPQY